MVLHKFDEGELKAIAYQWTEYADCYLKPVTNVLLPAQVLEELDGALVSKSYLAGNLMTEADSIVFSGLVSHMAKLSFQDKEHYINLSRWYNHMQSKTERENVILFSRMQLY